MFEEDPKHFFLKDRTGKGSVFLQVVAPLQTPRIPLYSCRGKDFSCSSEQSSALQQLQPETNFASTHRQAENWQDQPALKHRVQLWEWTQNSSSEPHPRQWQVNCKSVSGILDLPLHLWKKSISLQLMIVGEKNIAPFLVSYTHFCFVLFHFPHSFPSPETGPTFPAENKLKLLYKPQKKLLSCLTVGGTPAGPLLQCY